MNIRSLPRACGSAIALLAITTSLTWADEPGLDAATSAALDAAIAGDHRSAENKARDVYRHPKETLAFFGFRSDMTVVEIWPGAGWYTQILAPALRDRGKLYAAHYSLNPRHAYQRGYMGQFLSMLAADPKVYGNVTVTSLSIPYELDIAPHGTADMVLTFRNAHNWVNPSYGRISGPVTFQVMYDVLKPGGVLGVVDHRWPDPATEDPDAGNGYVSEQRIINMAEAAGFKFVARSDINRNDKDDHDHPQGVWTLPPTLALGDQDRDKYLAIGESDRMTLKFVKPAE